MIKSPDEYTLVVDAQRGPKEFQYDQVFMPDSSQEKVFEDTSVSFGFVYIEHQRLILIYIAP